MATDSDPRVAVVQVEDGNNKSKNATGFISSMKKAYKDLVIPTFSVIQPLAQIAYLLLLLQGASRHSSFSCPRLFAIAQLFEYFGNTMDLVLGNLARFFPTNRPRPFIRLVGDNVPGVDVIITTCGEYVDIVLDTALAACALDYPVAKFRVIIADDGQCDDLKARVAELSSKFPNLMYHRRKQTKGKYNGFKAGNINATIKMLAKEWTGVNPWIAVLDADMIPDPSMLRALMAHAFNNEKVALVTLPQDFYNIPVNDQLHQNMIIQHQQDQMGRDKFDAAWCPGTGFVVRYEAWKDIGGMPEFSICEDVIFGWFLNGSGWKTVHVNECLQSGLQPDSLAGHCKQRRKWWIGGIRNAISLNFGLSHPKLTQLTKLQRFAVVNQCPKAYLSTLFRSAAWIMMLICMGTGGAIVDTQTPDGLSRILGVYFTLSVMTRHSEYLGIPTYGSPNCRRRQEASYWQGVHLTKAVVQEFLPADKGGKHIGFAITGNKREEDEIKERDATTRPGMLDRVCALHASEGILYHFHLFLVVVTFTIFNSWCILVGSHATTREQTHSFWYQLVSAAMFPGLRLELILSFLSPVRYAMFPPTMQPRRHYMYLDEKTGGYRPLPAARGARFSAGCYLMEIPYAIATVWAGLAWWMIRNEAT